MTTFAKRTANQRNAERSTGPKTEVGKAVARMNAVAHGLRAASPVVPGEDPLAWEAYREAVESDLAPVGVLETELANRVALLSWRMRRVSTFEAGVVTRNSDKAARRVRGEEPEEASEWFSPIDRRSCSHHPLIEARRRAERAEQIVAEGERLVPLLTQLSTVADDVRLAGADALFVLFALLDYLPISDKYDEDDDGAYSDSLTNPTHTQFLLAVGMPIDLHDDPEDWSRWTAGVVRLGAERIARSVKWTGAKLLARAVAGEADQSDCRAELEAARRELALAETQAARDETEARRRALVPAKETIEIVMKYEGHLQRQLVQVLHELERRQALRSDCPPHPPAALEVTIHTAEGTTFPVISEG